MTTTPSPNPTRQVQAIAKEAEKQYKIGETLKWVAVGASATVGLAILAVVLLVKASTPRKIALVAGLVLLIGLAWGAWGVHRMLVPKIIEKKVREELKKAGIDFDSLSVKIQDPKY